MIAQLKAVVSELWGLFVDDGLLAALALAWMALVGFVVRSHFGPINSVALAVLFAAGLLAILAASVLRAVWRARLKRPSH